MTNRPEFTWYTTGADPSAPTRLLDDEGRPAPGLATDAELKRMPINVNGVNLQVGGIVTNGQFMLGSGFIP